nr:reverse transcriptase domain-containing protein [Tanacetum cinerariifolium]
MADTRTMSELLQVPIEGYGDAIVNPAILAKNFELKVGLLSLVTLSQFHGFERDAAGGNLLNRTPRDALMIIENKSKVRTSRNKPDVLKVNTTTSSSSLSLDIIALTDIIKELVITNMANKQASVKDMEETCVTCDGSHPYYECLATDRNTFNAYASTGTYNQGGMTLRVNDEAITFKVGHTLRYSRNSYDETVHQFNIIDVACEEYAQEVLGFSDSSTSGNPTPSDPINASSSPSTRPKIGIGYSKNV